MKAVVYNEPLQFIVTDAPERPLGENEVRVRVEVCGICGTDQHLHVGEFGPAYPLTPGHEMAGEIIEVGSSARNVSVGDRVAVDNTIYCGYCDNCKAGDFNFCQYGVALGVQAPGGFAETVVASADKCYQIGDLSLEAAAIIEPTACAVHGLERLDLRPGSAVLIIGAGPTSQILAQLLVHGGAGSVTMAAPTKFKLDVAKSHGIDNIVVIDRSDFLSSSDELRAIAPAGFDVVIEATGAMGVLQNVLPFVKSGGTLMVYGMAGEADTIAIPPYEVFRREITIKGSFAQSYDFERAIAFLSNGKVDPSGIVTHHFGLDAYGDALAALRSPDCLKAVVIPTK